jgi:MerR family transcriptional regulator, thiopeptide resistance regulator
MKTISITEVCRRTGLSSRTLRFYEARGLLPAQRSAADQRCYGETELARLHNITALKRAGFSLARIGELLDGKTLDLPRIIETQLASLAMQNAALSQASASLFAAQRALAAGRALDLDTFCTLIKQEATIMTDQEAWQKVYDLYYSPEEQAEWIALKQRAFADLDMDKYAADWKELTDRIEAALPFDPQSETATAFLAEWRVLQAPFLREAAPKLAAGTINLYDHIDEWSDIVDPPFSKAVYEAITAASAAQRVGTGSAPE